MNFYNRERANLDEESSSFSSEDRTDARADNYELLLNETQFNKGNKVRYLSNRLSSKDYNLGIELERELLSETQDISHGDVYISPPSNWVNLTRPVEIPKNLETEKADKIGILELWTKYNEQVTRFDDFYEGKNERELLQNIFHNITRLSNKVGISRDETPVGVFCATKEDLIKLDILLFKIKAELEGNKSRKQSFCNLL